MAETHADVNTPLLAMIGLIGSILVFAIIVLLTVIYYAVEAEEEYAKTISRPFTERENLLASQRARLVEYRWVDQQNEVVAIPIDRAMQLVVAERRRGIRPEPSSGGGKDSAGVEGPSATGTADDSASGGGEGQVKKAGEKAD